MADNFGFKPGFVSPTSPPYPSPSPPYPSPSPTTYPPGSYPPAPPSAYPPPTHSPYPPPGHSTYPSPPPSAIPPYQPPPVHCYPTSPPLPSCPPPLNYPTVHRPLICPPHSHYPPVHQPPICPPRPPQWQGSLVTHGHKAYYWLDWSAHRMVPPTAVHGGVDKDGTQIYVGRAFHEGDWIPAKVIPQKHVAYVAYGGGEHAKDSFQLLCEQRFDWVPTSGSNIPPGAVEGGRTSDGEALYVGRVYYDGAHTVGKVQPSHGSCYIPYDMREMAFPDYEILVLRS